MKLRILKKRNPNKLQRIWIKHLIEWVKLKTEYKSIKMYYIQSCKEKINFKKIYSELKIFIKENK